VMSIRKHPYVNYSVCRGVFYWVNKSCSFLLRVRIRSHIIGTNVRIIIMEVFQMITSTQSAEDMVLIRNLVVLPVVLSAFEADRSYFVANTAMTPYARLTDLTISRIRTLNG
jgi:hypothetical protein